MNKSMLGGIAIGVAVAAVAATFAGFNSTGNDEPAYADVINVSEITKTIETPREVCEDVAVTRQKEPNDKRKLLGTATGAVVGGLLGNQVGGGRGKTMATVAGAAAGGYAGNKVQGNAQAKKTETTTERKCSTVTDTREEVVGYNVSYRIGDQTGEVRMDEKPGSRIPVKDGKLVLDTPAATP